MSKKKLKKEEEKDKMKGKKEKEPREPKERWYNLLKEETKHSIFAIIFFVLGLFFSLASFGMAGAAGNAIYKILEALFGAGFFLVPTAFFLTTIALLTSFKPNFLSHAIIGEILFIMSSLGIADIVFSEKIERVGGLIGYITAWPFLKLFDYWISLVILIAIFIISLLIIFNTPLSFKLANVKSFRLIKKEDDKKEPISSTGKSASITDKTISTDEKQPASKISQATNAIKEIMTPKFSQTIETPAKKDLKERKIITQPMVAFVPPPLELLESDKGKPSSGDIKASANIIKRTLQNFGIEVEMGEINIGPSVTQYTLKPAEGVKLSRILTLQNDLSLALAAYPLRIEAPIPGKSLVGIEIPNSSKTIIGLATLLGDDGFKKSSHQLLLTMGRDVTGKAVFANLAKMPHALVAGATGAGKSIFIHSLIVSLLYKNSPESLRFIMIDPKRVELTSYNKIPHLLTSVITNPKKAIMALRWACKEMDRRYDELLKTGVRDIMSYHEKYGSFNSMPYLVIIIDELADMMSTYPREMEASIVRLAQMSRAVGIHLVISTQRPSVEVITGLIKANITTRVAMQVASQIDSRTILDMAGAEKLLGSGDMLFLAGDSAKPRRLQGALILEKEVEKVTKFIADQYKNVEFETGSEEKVSLEQNLEANNNDVANPTQVQFNLNLDSEDNADDDLYESAKDMVIKTGKASTSYLQRRFKVGYARAARLMDILEERGVVGPGEGAKPREVLMRDGDNANSGDISNLDKVDVDTETDENFEEDEVLDKGDSDIV